MLVAMKLNKAVLLNSADKIKDPGNGLRQGMTRTILAKNNRDWLESEAYQNRQISPRLSARSGTIKCLPRLFTV